MLAALRLGCRAGARKYGAQSSVEFVSLTMQEVIWKHLRARGEQPDHLSTDFPPRQRPIEDPCVARAGCTSLPPPDIAPGGRPPKATQLHRSRCRRPAIERSDKKIDAGRHPPVESLWTRQPDHRDERRICMQCPCAAGRPRRT